MVRRLSGRSRCLLFLALLPLGCGRVQGDVREADPLPSFILTPAEVETARDLAERKLEARGELGGLGKVVFCKVELLPGPHADAPQRLLRVTHYRYEGDQTIRTSVDLTRGEVRNVDVALHVPTPLAPEEAAHAEALARADARLKGVFARHGARLQVETIPCNPVEGDPLFGRRLAHILLGVEGAYLTAPRVLVDLTNDAVLVNGACPSRAGSAAE
ncbi:MAG: hypothetical protein IT429_00040 [Gemmataceae bacterium]|nr:hypothetical protein [Gemmataceae bacterium]